MTTLQDMTVEQLCRHYSDGVDEVRCASYAERLADVRQREKEGRAKKEAALAELRRRVGEDDAEEQDS